MTLVLEFVRAEEGGDPHAFRTGVQEYLLRWPGGSYDAITVRWDEALLADLAALRDPLRAREAAQRTGDWLQQLLAPTRWREHAAALTGTEEHVSMDIEIRSAAAELYALPWELLTLPGSGEHLAGLPGLRLRYRRPDAQPAPRPPAMRREGGRLLLAWSSAFGPVGESQFADAIAAAARAGGLAFDPAADVIPDVSIERLLAALEQACAAAPPALPPAILHILCHGVAHGGAFALGLGTAAAPDVVDAARARLLAPFARQIRLVVLTACDGASVGAPGSHLGGVAQALHAVGFEAVIAARAPIGGRAALDFTGSFYTELIESLATVDEAFVVARRHLRIGVSGPDWAQLQLHAHAPGARPLVFRPYRGLLPFEPAHARLYFGRDAECAEAVSDLDALIVAGKPRLLVIAGASGSGKSSVALAGVVPRLAARGVPAGVMRPGRDPQRALAEAMAARPAAGRFLLVVDQFEEVFTHAGSTSSSGHAPGDSVHDGARAFARALWQLAADPAGEVAVVLTLRVDYLGRCGDLVLDDAGTRLDRIAYDEAHRVFVAQMTRERLRETIDGPAARLGLTVEAGLRERLLQEIGDEPSALPLLQYALDELWARRDGDTLTHAALDALGGAVGALARRADAVLDDMSEEERAAARRLLVRAAAYADSPASGTRRQRVEGEVRPTDAARGAAWDRAVRALVDARLIVRRTRDDGDVLLDISHEALIRNWPRLWSWYQEDRTRLAEQTQLHEWVEEWRRFPDNLLAGNKLGFALRLRELQGDELSPAARELIAASEAAEQRRRDEAQRRLDAERERDHSEILRARRRTRLTLAASAVLLAALVFSGLQWRAATSAEEVARHASEVSDRNAALAHQNLMRSEARRLAALATAAREREDPVKAILFAAEAAAAEAVLGADLQIADVSQELRELLALVPEHRSLPAHQNRPTSALAWSPDGSLLAEGLWGYARVIEVGADRPPRDFPIERSSPVKHMAWARDGRRLFVAYSEGDAELWDVTGPTRVWARECGSCILRDRPAAMKPDGSLVAVLDDHGYTLHLVDPASDRDQATLRLPGDAQIVGVEWGASGALLAFSSGLAQVWPDGPASTPVTFDLGPGVAVATDAALSPDGARFAVVSDDATHIVPIAATADTPTITLAGGRSLRFDAAGERLVVARDSGSFIWFKGQDPGVRELPMGDRIVRVEFAPGGRWLLGVDDRSFHNVRVWDLADPATPAVRVTQTAIAETIAFDGAGERIAIGGRDASRIWPFPLRRDPIELAGDHLAVAWAAGGAEVVALTADGAIARFSATGDVLARRPAGLSLEHFARPVFSPDGHVLAFIRSGTSESVLVDVDASPPRQHSAPARPDAPAPLWSADGSRVLVVRGDTSLLARRRDGGDDRVLAGLPRFPTALAVARDGSKFAAATEGALVWWSLERPDVAHTLAATAGAIDRLEFDAAGERLLARGRDAAVILSLSGAHDPIHLGNSLLGRVDWAGFGPGPGQVAVDREGGTPLTIRAVEGGEPLLVDPVAETIIGGAFSPDGTRLVTVNFDERITLRRADRAGEPAVLAPLPGRLRTLLWSPDGRHLLTLHDDGRARIIAATTAGLVARACARLPVELDDPQARRLAVGEGHEETCLK